MAQLRETEGAIEAAKEDEKVIKKIIELANLLRTNKEVSFKRFIKAEERYSTLLATHPKLSHY